MTVFSGSIEDRFWEKVIKGPSPDHCWLWTGAVADYGYGRFTLNGGGQTQAVRPHRFAFHLATGIPLHGFGPLMHDCDVPELTHLLEGTDRENMLDRLAKRRDKNGSEFRWRGLAREHFAARSRALRDEVRDYGWSRPERVCSLIAGVDPAAPTLF